MRKIRPKFHQRFMYGFAKVRMKRYINKNFSFKPTPFDLAGPYLVVYNKVSHIDQYELMRSFKQYMYFTYDDSIIRDNPDVAKWQKFFGNIPVSSAKPIVEYKDQIVKLIKDGNNVCINPELFTNYSGITSPVDKGIADIVKEANCTLVTYCFRGGYFMEPAWAKTIRRGWQNGHIVNVYSKFDLANLTNNEICKVIADDIKEDAYARQCNSPITYDGENLAEGIENVLYLCPNCGEYDSFESSGNDYHCTHCDVRGSYTNQGIIHANFRFKTIADFLNWEETQIERISDSDIDFNDEDVTLSIIKDNYQLKKVETNKMHIDKDGIHIGEHSFLFENIKRMDVKEKGTVMVFSYDNDCYQLTKPGFKPLKYRKLYYKRKASIETYGKGPK